MIQTFILIIILAGNWGSSSGASATGIEFDSRSKCEQAKEQVLNNQSVSRITAFCVEK